MEWQHCHLYKRPDEKSLNGTRPVYGLAFYGQTKLYYAHFEHQSQDHYNTLIGQLGTQGWEMFAITESGGGYTDMYFKRHVQAGTNIASGFTVHQF